MVCEKCSARGQEKRGLSLWRRWLQLGESTTLNGSLLATRNNITASCISSATGESCFIIANESNVVFWATWGLLNTLTLNALRTSGTSRCLSSRCAFVFVVSRLVLEYVKLFGLAVEQKRQVMRLFSFLQSASVYTVTCEWDWQQTHSWGGAKLEASEMEVDLSSSSLISIEARAEWSDMR